LFCREPYPGIRTEVVPVQWLPDMIGRIPFARRLRDLRVLLSDQGFDRYVARRIRCGHLFQGVIGQCKDTLEAAHSQGCPAVLNCLTTHIGDLGPYMDRECAKFGVRPPIGTLMRARMEVECSKADLIRVGSTHARRTFLERGFSPDRVIVARPPIDVSEFPIADFADSVFRIGFVGLIEPWKGFHYLVDAYSSLNLRDSELVLWGGCGSRPISRYLRTQTARDPTIQVKPVVKQRSWYDEVYTKCSVIVHPSLSDGFGYVVVEAMACGVPVIVTANTGASELITEGVNGYIVAAGDVSGIADRLKYLAQHREIIPTMGAAARRAMEQLDKDSIRTTYADVLMEIT
jgi:glycosyltransferase involved in cell wall biosynthesis